MIITKEQKAILYMLSASLLFSVVAMLAKLVFELGAVEITFFRNLVGILFLLSFFKYGKPKKFDSSKLPLLLFRGFIGTVALIAFFYNVGAVSLADAMTLVKTEPLFSALLAFWLMSERLDKTKVAAIFIGFLGIFIIGAEKGISLAYPNLVGIFGGFCAALAYTSVRRLKDDFDHRFVVLSFMGFGTLLPLLIMLIGSIDDFGFIKGFTIPSSKEFLFLALIGVFSAGGQVFMTKAYFYAKAGIVSTVGYSSMLFGVIFGIMAGDPYPSLIGFLGMGFIIASGFLITKK
jgi:drug/metabolite transporter (DMT)-like permease